MSLWWLWEGLAGVIGVDLIGQIRRAFFEQRRAIKEISRELRVSRTTVRKVMRSDKTAFKYARGVQPAPKLGDWIGPLTEIVEEEATLPKRERRSTQRLFEELRGCGYDGAHDSVHRFVKEWREERARVPAQAFVPMSFAPGEAYQFDWSHETITLQGLPLMVKAAHMKLSHSRMPFVRTYFRETQELVFDAHDKAFQFCGGACRRGIYDNMKTAVEAIFIGKARQYNRRFLQMCSHHLYLLFVAVFCSLFAAVQVRIWRKFFAAKSLLRTQLFIIGINITVVGLVGVYFDLILPSPFLEDFRYIWTGPIFTDLFAAATAFSIFRYRLFNTKAVFAEFLVFAIWIVLLVRILTSVGISDLLANAAVLALAVPIGLLLIRSVNLEVQARETLSAANTKLMELDRLKSEFLSLAAHQLRGPVTIIRGYLAGITDGDYGPVPQALALPIDRASESARSFAGLIDDYLNVSRIEQGQMAYTFVSGDFAELIRRVAEQYAPLAEKKGLRFSCTVDAVGSYRTKIDIDKMTQVVSNLIDNAIKYTVRGAVAITLVRDAALGRMLFSVTDSGAGIDPTVLPPSFRNLPGPTPPAPTQAAAAWGYTSARQFVEAHGGRIWAESAGVGHGAAFIVELPLG